MSRFGNGGPPAHAQGRGRQQNQEDSERETQNPENDSGGTTAPDTGSEPSSGGERFFSYSENGLSYTVRVYDDGDGVKADIRVVEGSMDVNAVYVADDNFYGDSADLGGPLNMNGDGSRFEGQTIQWDDAIALNQPGLGRPGREEDTFLSQGEMLTVDLNASSVDDVDFFGIRATSVNGGDSIKGVSGNPESEPEPEPDPEPEEPGVYDKVFFAANLNEDGLPIGGRPILLQDLLEENPEATGTFAEYLEVYMEDPNRPVDEDPIAELQAVVFYTVDGETLEEAFRLEGPFDDEDALLSAYDEAIQAADVEAHMVSFVSEDETAEDDEDENSEEYAMM